MRLRGGEFRSCASNSGNNEVRLEKSDFDDFLSDRIPNEIRQALEFELQHDASPVPFHSAHANSKPLSNLPVRLSLS